ncbi:DUF3558 domain-containing protein [Nocardia terpenica]|uniref:DUF3558 domain-containing protein n=1 Tax=Nocardia terpenica TaxID=455432 RepID=UPI001559BB55|nr:DUF3558 domain-containing protein [Nocardia terpenica]NQE89320.1 DUF3558 domain-containing protein [Nocardia terpenica]
MLAMTALLIAACNSGNNVESTTSTEASATSSDSSGPAHPTLTASRLQPPSQDTGYAKSGGRPKVIVDPCTWIPDDAVSTIGFDPATRKRMHDQVAEYTFLTCQFSNADGALQLASGNITLDEDKQRYAGKYQEIDINGRNAIQLNKTGTPECDLDMQTKVGYFEVSVLIDSSGRGKGVQPCGNIVQVASTLEPFIGKDN